MPRTLRLSDGSYMRRSDVQILTQYLFAMHCVEVVGFSNLGKSALLRLLSQLDVWTQELGEAGREFLPIFIDCNHMLEMNDQGFYELVLRSFRENSSELADIPELTEAYEMLVSPANEIQVPLSFNRGISTVLESTRKKLVLLFDEFDEPFNHIDSRVFLNLRALKDRHPNEIVYVTATIRPLEGRHQVDHYSEFRELFNHRTWYLAPLTRSDVDRMIRRYMEAYDAPFMPADFDFIYQWSGGHPGMIEGACRTLERILDEQTQPLDTIERWQLHHHVSRQLRQNESLLYECTKIWDMCHPEEQTALMSLFQASQEAEESILERLLRRHILLKIEGKPQVFCRLFAEYVQRMVSQDQPEATRLWVNSDSGEVIVSGAPVDTLTNLEYRLMELLFQNATKIVNKYQIVTSVWGESYIDEVDDARIEKLVSRLRQKIEPNPTNPTFLTTVRGRGYRLVLE
ncbi:winged helix-turn-helix domain-containing protein [Chloroflexi bacterium TSY]|nr:winged helix-turn-helix domain-containing protein [Chloroflexi bacterium TSY]